jgi:phage terminase large subunit-like protein
MIIDTYKKYKHKRVRIETVGYQEALRSTVRKMMIDQNLYIPGLERGIKPRNRKSERLLSMVPILAKGEFYFRPEDIHAQQEFLSYPRGKHDDILDAIYYAMEPMKPAKNKSLTQKVKKSSKIIDWMTL